MQRPGNPRALEAPSATVPEQRRTWAGGLGRVGQAWVPLRGLLWTLQVTDQAKAEQNQPPEARGSSGPRPPPNKKGRHPRPEAQP